MGTTAILADDARASSTSLCGMCGPGRTGRGASASSREWMDMCMRDGAGSALGACERGAVACACGLEHCSVVGASNQYRYAAWHAAGLRTPISVPAIGLPATSQRPLQRTAELASCQIRQADDRSRSPLARAHTLDLATPASHVEGNASFERPQRAGKRSASPVPSVCPPPAIQPASCADRCAACIPTCGTRSMEARPSAMASDTDCPRRWSAEGGQAKCPRAGGLGPLLAQQLLHLPSTQHVHRTVSTVCLLGTSTRRAGRSPVTASVAQAGILPHASSTVDHRPSMSPPRRDPWFADHLGPNTRLLAQIDAHDDRLRNPQPSAHLH
ncbi:hypothetical protein FA95DRAFT_981614 [Auriscalpium vulgare]|uniref:Uncharacterized protein n=1 Tax=Auriscalpium vulgare TaxID=40419 RepID=A0ACB8R765_9AGAM|nr:hypothetical protein FA95DRAFT_981614 [Auriscalpium vulgare]